MRYKINNLILYVLVSGFVLALIPMAKAMPMGVACAPMPSVLLVRPVLLVETLEAQPKPLLRAMDDYVAQMEGCYDAPLGLLQLTPLVKNADALTQRLATARALAEQKVRGREGAHEKLLSSRLWADLNALRVAAAYAAGWGHLSLAVRQISAQKRRQQLAEAARRFAALGFEFRHPIVVQRAIYAQAVTHLENGNVAAARERLEHLRHSLNMAEGDNKEAETLRAIIEPFYAEISAPDFVPPQNAPAEKSAQNAAPTQNAAQAQNAEQAVVAARQAFSQSRPVAEILTLIEPAINNGTPATIGAALDLLVRDPSLIAAAPFPPLPALAAMRAAFARGDYAATRDNWAAVKAYMDVLPLALRRQINYQMGASLLNLNAADKALPYLYAARKKTAFGAQQKRLDALIILARLSENANPDDAPDTALLALAQAHRHLPQKRADGGVDALALLIAQQARIVLARAAAAQQNWGAADRLLSGFGPDNKAYKLFTGMRVRMLAYALQKSQSTQKAEKLAKRAKGGYTLYQLWLFAECPKNCVTGDALAVHRAALQLVVLGQLDSVRFGAVWGAFVEAGGDMRPHVGLAIDYLMQQKDADRLLALLEPADEALAAFVLRHWQAKLKQLTTAGLDAATRDFLANEMAALQARPRAILLEALVREALARQAAGAEGAAAEALQYGDALVAEFPRRPSAWFLRAAALQQNDRNFEAARTLSALVRNTPADDPIGMGARLGLAALFVALDKRAQACAMQRKIFSHPHATQNWQQAAQLFNEVKTWRVTMNKACPA